MARDFFDDVQAIDSRLSREEFVPPSVQPLLDSYLQALEPLRPLFYGVYVYGSIALGGFEEQESDIDILAVTHEEWSPHELVQLQVLHTQLLRTHQLCRRLEVLYLPLHDIGKRERDIAPYPNAQFGKFSPSGYTDFDLVMWWTVKHKSLCLLGPERSALPIEVTWGDVLETMCEHLRSFWAFPTNRPYLFLLDGWIEIAVSTLCRMLTTIEEGDITTKSVAIKHWRNRLPARWLTLIDEAWRIRHHLRGPSLYRSPLKRKREVLAFIEYVREREGKVLEAALAGYTQ